MNLKDFLEENDIISEMVRTIEPDIADKELQQFINEFLGEKNENLEKKTLENNLVENDIIKENENIISIQNEIKESAIEKSHEEVKVENEMLRTIIKESVFLFLEKKFQEEKVNKLTINLESPTSKNEYVNAIPFPIKEVQKNEFIEEDIQTSVEIINENDAEMQNVFINELEPTTFNEPSEIQDEVNLYKDAKPNSKQTIYTSLTEKNKSKNKFLILGLLATILIVIASFFIFSDGKKINSTSVSTISINNPNSTSIQPVSVVSSDKPIAEKIKDVSQPPIAVKIDNNTKVNIQDTSISIKNKVTINDEIQNSPKLTKPIFSKIKSKHIHSFVKKNLPKKLSKNLMSMFISKNNKILAFTSLVLVLIIISSCSLFKNKQTVVSNIPITNETKYYSVDNYNPKKFNKVSLKSTFTDEQLHKVENIYFGYGNDIHADPIILSLNDIESNWGSYRSFKSISVFPISKFDIDESIKPMAIKVYTPLVDSIIQQSKLYASRNVVVQVFLVGYTDAIGIKEDAELYLNLKNRMKHIPMTKENMNRHLSFLRACEIGKLLNEIIVAKNIEFEYFDKVFIQLVQEGKGEELPDTKKRYTANDEDRRVVKIYWKILQGN